MGRILTYVTFPTTSERKLVTLFNNERQKFEAEEREAEGYGGTIYQLSQPQFVTQVFNGLDSALDYIEKNSRKKEAIAVPYTTKDKKQVMQDRYNDARYTFMMAISGADGIIGEGISAATNDNGEWHYDERELKDPEEFYITPPFGDFDDKASSHLIDMSLVSESFKLNQFQRELNTLAADIRRNHNYGIWQENSQDVRWVIGGLAMI